MIPFKRLCSNVVSKSWIFIWFVKKPVFDYGFEARTLKARDRPNKAPPQYLFEGAGSIYRVVASFLQQLYSVVFDPGC